jgi:hypothetical protein
LDQIVGISIGQVNFREGVLTTQVRAAIAQEAGVTPQYLSMLIGPEFRAAAQGLPGARRTVDTTLRQALERQQTASARP